MYVYNVMRIFCLVFYMTNFLNCICIQSIEDKITERNKTAQYASKHFFLVFKVILTNKYIVAVMSLNLVFIRHSLQCF